MLSFFAGADILIYLTEEPDFRGSAIPSVGRIRVNTGVGNCWREGSAALAGARQGHRQMPTEPEREGAGIRQGGCRQTGPERREEPSDRGIGQRAAAVPLIPRPVP